jgi:histidine triad (HIT) family protein
MNVFEKIIRREIPAVIVYEDEETLAFMDIRPIIKGHTLVIPKTSYASVLDAPDEVLAKVMRICRLVAEAQVQTLGAEGVNLIQNSGAAAGQEVPHLHFHIIPRFQGDGHCWNWNAGHYDTPAEMEAVAAKLRAGISA